MSFNNNPFISKHNNNKCHIANCLECLTFNECKLCKPDFIFAENKCYLKECSIFGNQCKYCTEFDCVSCKKGYKISYGFCERDEYLAFLERFLGIILPIFLIFVIFIFIIIFRKNKKKSKQKIVKAEIIQKKRPSTGQYIIYNNTQNNNNIIIKNDEKKENENLNEDNNINKCNENEQFINIEDLRSEYSSGSNNCVICGKKKIFSFSICGCALCREHSIPQNLICPNHNIVLNRKLYIKKTFNDVEIIPIDKSKYVKLCSICNIEPATMDFNCDCPVKVCNKCFNDNVYIFNIKRCPGCNKEYVVEK